MFWRKCGANILEDSQFCVKCGVAVMATQSGGPSGTAPEAAALVEGAPERDNLHAPVATAEETASSQSWHRPVFIIGLFTLLLWAVHDVWQYGLLGAAFDPLLWLLGIPLYLLYRRSESPPAKSKVSPIKSVKAVQGSKPEGAAGSPWARLGIFLCVAVASVILATVVFLKGNLSAVELTEKMAKVSLTLGLAAWGFSEVVAGRWLTIKRTLIAAIALHSIAFILMAVFLGKPLATRLAELDAQQAELDRQFRGSATGKTLLQPQSFANPLVAAASLAEFGRYAHATESLNRRREAPLLERDDPSFRDHWTEYFEAARSVASATEELYRFAAEPSLKVHVENGVVVIADPDGYNKRIDAVNSALEKLRLTTAAIKEPVPKGQK